MIPPSICLTVISDLLVYYTSCTVQKSRLFGLKYVHVYHLQMYIYEYGDLTVEDRPRHICPYAVIDFRYVGQTKVYRNLSQKQQASPR